MNNSKARKTAAAGILVTLLVGVLFGWVGGSGEVQHLGLSAFGWCVAIAFLIQVIAFIPAFIYRTEHFYDLVGGLTYITVTLIALALAPEVSRRGWIVSGLIIVWAARLGAFLFVRTRKAGKDGRFDAIKQDFIRFLLAWLMQGVWVTFTAAAALAIITNSTNAPMHFLGWFGVGVWLFGFLIELIADIQKYKFKQKPQNKDAFINTGLWSLSRHPNYFGEITLWVGVALIAVSELNGWQYITLISPIFVFILLKYISGVSLLEKRADERWGDDSAYQDYKARTPELVLGMTARTTRK